MSRNVRYVELCSVVVRLHSWCNTLRGRVRGKEDACKGLRLRPRQASNRDYPPVSAAPVCRRMGKLRNRIEYLKVDTGVYEINAHGKPSELTGFEAMDVTMVSPSPVSCVPCPASRVLCSVSSAQLGSQIEGKPIQLGSLCPDDWQHSLCPDDCPDYQGNRCA
jgi:hypothetical protein